MASPTFSISKASFDSASLQSTSPTERGIFTKSSLLKFPKAMIKMNAINISHALVYPLHPHPANKQAHPSPKSPAHSPLPSHAQLPTPSHPLLIPPCPARPARPHLLGPNPRFSPLLTPTPPIRIVEAEIAQEECDG